MLLALVRLPPTVVPLVVGKQGANIKDLQQRCGVAANIEPHPRGGPQCLHIYGEKVSVKGAVATLNRRLRESRNSECSDIEYVSLAGADAQRAKNRVAKATSTARSSGAGGASSAAPAPQQQHLFSLQASVTAVTRTYGIADSDVYIPGEFLRLPAAGGLLRLSQGDRIEGTMVKCLRGNFVWRVESITGVTPADVARLGARSSTTSSLEYYTDEDVFEDVSPAEEEDEQTESGSEEGAGGDRAWQQALERSEQQRAQEARDAALAHRLQTEMAAAEAAAAEAASAADSDDAAADEATREEVRTLSKKGRKKARQKARKQEEASSSSTQVAQSSANRSKEDNESQLTLPFLALITAEANGAACDRELTTLDLQGLPWADMKKVLTAAARQHAPVCLSYFCTLRLGAFAVDGRRNVAEYNELLNVAVSARQAGQLLVLLFLGAPLTQRVLDVMIQAPRAELNICAPHFALFEGTSPLRVACCIRNGETRACHGDRSCACPYCRCMLC